MLIAILLSLSLLLLSRAQLNPRAGARIQLIKEVKEFIAPYYDPYEFGKPKGGELSVNVSVNWIFLKRVYEEDQRSLSLWYIGTNYTFLIPGGLWDPSENANITQVEIPDREIWSPLLYPCLYHGGDWKRQDLTISSHVVYHDGRILTNFNVLINTTSKIDYYSLSSEICFHISSPYSYERSLHFSMLNGPLTGHLARISNSDRRINAWTRDWDVSPIVNFTPRDRTFGAMHMKEVHIALSAARSEYGRSHNISNYFLFIGAAGVVMFLLSRFR